MPCPRAKTILLTAVVFAALWVPVHAGVSIGIHGGHHGNGVHLGYHGGHHGYHGRHHYGYSGYRYRGYAGYRHHGYRHRGYRHGRYGYSRHRSHPYRSYSTYSPRRADPYPSQGESTGREASPDAYTDGWKALRAGEALQALSIFGHDAKSRPARGVPKAGYALAAASSGNFERAVWAMRRAFSYEPEALTGLANDAAVHETVDELIAHYEYDLDEDAEHPDAAFMVAALNVLNGRVATARSAAAQAAEAGDDSESFRNLERVLSADVSVRSRSDDADDDRGRY